MFVNLNVHCDAFGKVKVEIDDEFFEKDENGRYELTDGGYDMVNSAFANLFKKDILKSKFEIDYNSYQGCGVSTLDGQTIVDWNWE